MRLIDADDIKATYMVASTTTNSLCHLYVSKEDIDSAPTVEAEPVRHGRWIDRNGNIVAPFWERYECSICGARSDESEYCPHCGAKMTDGDE